MIKTTDTDRQTEIGLSRAGRCALWAMPLGLLLGGCGGDGIETLQVPKEEPRAATAEVPAATAGADDPQARMGLTALPGMAEQAEAFPAPDMIAPAHWAAQAAGSMRKGSWLIADAYGHSADMSVLAFPGDVGGLRANLDRWNEQIGNPSLDDAAYAAILRDGSRDIGGEPGVVVFLRGQAGQSTLGAIVAQGGGTWFFKMMGDTELVEQEQALFGSFLDSVTFH